MRSHLTYETYERDALSSFGSTLTCRLTSKCPVPPKRDRRGPCLPAGRKGTIKTIFPLLASLPPLRAREAPACLSRPDGVAGELQCNVMVNRANISNGDCKTVPVAPASSAQWRWGPDPPEWPSEPDEIQSIPVSYQAGKSFG